jgi:hypothetical protein
VKRRRKLGFLVVVAVAIGTTFWLVLRPRDPVYQGQTLSYWFDQFNTTNRPQAAIAIRQLGTNAVPFVLEKAKSKDGDTLYERLYRTIYYTNSYAREQAAIALWRINRDTNVIPDLISELGSASAATAYARILTALREMGPSARAAVPVIIKTIKDQGGMPNNHGIDIRAVGLKALEEIDPEAATKAGVK